MAAIPLIDGATWDGTATGREWEVHGTGLTRDEFRPSYTFEVANPGGGYVDHSDHLVSFRFRRGIRNWWQGMRPATGQIVLEQTEDGPATTITVGFLARLTVSVPSGDKVIFWGRVNRATHKLDARKGTTTTLGVTDQIGWNSQVAIPAAGASTATSSNAIRSLLSTYGEANITGIAAGVGRTVDTAYSAGNMLDTINQIVRSETGILWQDTGLVWQYRTRNWWYPIPTTTVAALGPVTPTAPTKTYTYNPPVTNSIFEASIMDVKNDVTWTGPFTGSPYTQNTGAPSTLAHTRQYSDTVRNTAASATAHVDLIQSRLSNVANLPRVKQARFPADIAADAMEYAAIADVKDYVEINLTSFVDTPQNWKLGWVMGVTHEWSPLAGWWTTLDIDQSVPETELTDPV